MHLPPTRRGRYLLYRLRQKNRRRYAATRSPSLPAAGYYNGGHATRLGCVLFGWEKQTGRTYPLDPTHFTDPPLPRAAWRVPPSRGVWGVLPLLPPYESGVGHEFHASYARQGYFKRRVTSTPKVRHLEKRAYLFAKEDLPPGAFYPFDLYPSGAPSYRSTLPP